jgi:hypothetical protein
MALLLVVCVTVNCNHGGNTLLDDLHNQLRAVDASQAVGGKTLLEFSNVLMSQSINNKEYVLGQFHTKELLYSVDCDARNVCAMLSNAFVKTRVVKLLSITPPRRA